MSAHHAPPGGAAPAAALDDLTPTLYLAMRTRARRERRRARAGETLDTTAVVHETFLRLAAQRCRVWEGRDTFLVAAAAMMRRVIIDDWRRRRAERRGGRAEAVTLGDDTPAAGGADARLDALRPALERLAAYDERLARVTAARYLAGLTEEEIALALGVTVRTVRRDWVKARGWLRAAVAEDA